MDQNTQPQESKSEEFEASSEMGIMMYGLTKREYFAALMLPALGDNYNPDKAARIAVKYADALIAELKREPSDDE